MEFELISNENKEESKPSPAITQDKGGMKFEIVGKGNEKEEPSMFDKFKGLFEPNANAKEETNSALLNIVNEGISEAPLRQLNIPEEKKNGALSQASMRMINQAIKINAQAVGQMGLMTNPEPDENQGLLSLVRNSIGAKRQLNGMEVPWSAGLKEKAKGAPHITEGHNIDTKIKDFVYKTFPDSVNRVLYNLVQQPEQIYNAYKPSVSKLIDAYTGVTQDRGKVLKEGSEEFLSATGEMVKGIGEFITKGIGGTEDKQGFLRFSLDKLGENYKTDPAGSLFSLASLFALITPKIKGMGVQKISDHSYTDWLNVIDEEMRRRAPKQLTGEVDKTSWENAQWEAIPKQLKNDIKALRESNEIKLNEENAKSKIYDDVVKANEKVEVSEPEGIKALPSEERFKHGALVPSYKLTPAIIEGNGIIAGKLGGTHPDILKENELEPETPHERGFVDLDGLFLDRTEGKEYVKENQPEVYDELLKLNDGDEKFELHSQDYNQAIDNLKNVLNKIKESKNATVEGEISENNFGEHSGVDKIRETPESGNGDSISEGGIGKIEGKGKGVERGLRLDDEITDYVYPKEPDVKITLPPIEEQAKELGLTAKKWPDHNMWTIVDPENNGNFEVKVGENVADKLKEHRSKGWDEPTKAMFSISKEKEEIKNVNDTDEKWSEVYRGQLTDKGSDIEIGNFLSGLDESKVSQSDIRIPEKLDKGHRKIVEEYKEKEIDVIFFDGSNEASNINGYMIRNNLKNIYINTNSNLPFSIVAKHEIAHIQSLKFPEEYKKLVEDIIPEIVDIDKFMSDMSDLYNSVLKETNETAKEAIVNLIEVDEYTNELIANLAAGEEYVYIKDVEKVKGLIDDFLDLKPEKREVDGGVGGKTEKGSADLTEFHSIGLPSFRAQMKAFNKIPAVKSVKEAIQRAFAPESISKNAEIVDTKLIKAITENEHIKNVIVKALEEQNKMWQKIPEHERMKFIFGLEDPTKLPEIYADTAKEHKLAYEAIFLGEMASGIPLSFIRDYIPHIFNKPEEIKAFVHSKFKSLGKDKFTKERTIETLREALAIKDTTKLDDLRDELNKKYNNKTNWPQKELDKYNEVKKNLPPKFKLKTTNPAEILQIRMLSAQTAIMKMNLINDLININLAKKWQKELKDEGYEMFGAPDGNFYGVPRDVYPILNNAILAPSIWSDPTWKGDMFRAASHVKNLIVPIKLAISGFHAVHVFHISTSDRVSQAIYHRIQGGGTIGSMVKDIGTSILQKHQKEEIQSGWRIMKAWDKPIPELTPDEKLQIQYLTEAGVVPKMSAEWKSNARESMMKSFHEGKYGKLPIQSIFALIDILQAPLFEYYIPSLKVGSALHDIKQTLERKPNLINDPITRGIAFREIGKGIDNMYGEVFYKGVFMNKILKEAGIFSSLSMGWNLGNVRQFAGGITDTGKLINKLSKMEKPVREDITRKMVFTGIYTAFVAIIGGLTTWALTGKAPETTEDYFFPQTGDYNPDGTPIRMVGPYSTRDYTALAYNINKDGLFGGTMNVIKGKANPLIHTAFNLFENKDFKNVEIHDEDDPYLKQVWDVMKYLTKESLTPISIDSYDRERKIGMSKTKSFVTTALGYNIAPKYITNTAMQNAITNLSRKRGSGIRDAGSSEISDARYNMKILYQQGKDEEAQAIMDDLKERGKISKEGIEAFNKTINLPSDIVSFSRLKSEDQIRLLKKMDINDMNRYVWFAAKKVFNEKDLENTKLDEISRTGAIFVDEVKDGNLTKPKWSRGKIED